jgi:hypothetical protein
MTDPQAVKPDRTTETMEEAKLPRKDWIVLPLLGVLTLAFVFGSMELLARQILPEEGALFVGACMVINNPLAGLQAIPNSVCKEKAAEGQLTEYRFNSCGHRAGMECGPKPPNTYRIVMAGSSYGFGYGVMREQTFAALLPVELSRQTGRKIELYNASMAGRMPRAAALRFDELLAAKPDMILWELAPADVEGVQLQAIDPDARVWGKSIDPQAKFAASRELILHKTYTVWKHSSGWYDHIAILLRHSLYNDESQEQYVNSYLMNGDESAGFLKADWSPRWQVRLEQFDSCAANMEEKAKAAGIPFVAVLLPNRAQAAMISMGKWPTGYDPYKLDEKLRFIIVSHGGIYLDILPQFRKVPSPEQYFFPVDGHPTSGGHAIIATLLAKELTGGAVPALKAPAQFEAVSEQTR